MTMSIETLKNLRKHSHYTKKDLAYRCKVSESLLCKIEAGKRNITPQLDKRLRKAFRIPQT